MDKARHQELNTPKDEAPVKGRTGKEQRCTTRGRPARISHTKLSKTNALKGNKAKQARHATKVVGTNPSKGNAREQLYFPS